MERVLITGGAGYIGSVLTSYLLEKRYRVTCLDNLMFRQSSPLRFITNPDFDFVYGDARDEDLLKKIIPEFDVLIPLAAIVGAPACDNNPKDAREINLEAVKLLNKIRTPNQKLIYPNTNSGYGTKSGDVFCTEESPLDPVSLYGKTKVDAEKHLLESGKDAITLRLATVFGVSPRMRDDLLVNTFVLKAVSDGYIILYEADNKRNYVHIKDVAACFEYCIRNFTAMKNKPYNLGLDEANLSKRELAEKVKEHAGKFEIVCMEIGSDPDKRNYIVSNERLKKAGFACSYSLDEGIKELVKYYKLRAKIDAYRNA